MTRSTLTMKILRQFFAKSGVGAILLFAGLFFIQQDFAQGSQTFTTVGANNFTAPAGVTTVTVECWGGGGAGGGNNSTNGTGGGGGGGSYVKTLNVGVASGTIYTITVGAGGISSVSAGLGGTSTAVLVTSVSAAGGNGGTFATNGVGATGGTGTNNGGTGSNGASGNFGGGGGGGAGTAVNGNTVIATAAGATAVTGGGPGGNGASGSNGNGSPGTAPGGGGGGARAGGGSRTGGAGGSGQVIISWTCPAATISYAGTPFCKSASSGVVTVTGTSGGTFSAPAGLTINTATGEVNPSASTAGTYTVHYQIASGGNGCTAVDATTTVTVSQPPISSVSAQTNITCLGANDGTITVSASDGTAPYTFSIDNGTNFLAPTGTNLRLFTGLAPNTPYTIKVKDNKGCISK